MKTLVERFFTGVRNYPLQASEVDETGWHALDPTTAQYELLKADEAAKIFRQGLQVPTACQIQLRHATQAAKVGWQPRDVGAGDI